MGPVRAVISDGVFHRFQIQLDMNKMQGIRNLAEHPQLTGARLVKEERFGKYLSVDFLVRGRVHDRDVKAEGGATVSENGSEEFEEIWSFTRLAEGAMGEPPLVDGGDASSPQVLKALANCPKCAAPLSDAGGSRCGSCGAVLNSGAYDWVLAEITQAEEWAAGNRADLDGYYSALPVTAGTDARAWLSPQELEDRASVVFVRYQSALHRGNLSSLALFAAPELLQRLSGPGKEPPLYRLAVGAVDLSGFSAVAGLAKAWIRVKFSGAPRRADEPEHQERVLVFSKSLDAAMGKNALSSMSCPACGGPLESTDQAKCAYCGAVLASPEANWVLCDYGGNALLSQVMAPRALPDSAGKTRAAAAAGPGAQFRLLSAMIAAALEDGVISAQEETTIRDFARNFGLGPIFVDTLLRKVKTDPEALNQPIGAQEALRWLNNFIMVAASDGVITAQEEALILAFARRQNLDEGKTRYALKAALRGKA
jgi:tellurite resistance protein